MTKLVKQTEQYIALDSSHGESMRLMRLENALKLIAGHAGKCIFNRDPAFREGSATAYAQLGEIARAALEGK